MMIGQLNRRRRELAGMGEGADYGQMAVTSIFSNVASGAVVAALQSFNLVIPGLGLVLAFAFKKLFGAIFAGTPPDPEAPAMKALADQLILCAQTKDYAGGAPLAMNAHGFSWLHYATGGKSDRVFFANVLGDAMRSHNWTRLEQFACFVDASASLLNNAVEGERVAILSQVEGMLATMMSPNCRMPGYAYGASVSAVRLNENNQWEALALGEENKLVAVTCQEGGDG